MWQTFRCCYHVAQTWLFLKLSKIWLHFEWEVERQVVMRENPRFCVREESHLVTRLLKCKCSICNPIILHNIWNSRLFGLPLVAVGGRSLTPPPTHCNGGQKRLSSVRRKSCGFQCTQYNHTTQGWTQFETRLIHGQVPFRGQKLLQFTCCSFVKQASILSLGTSQFSLSSIVNAMQCQVLWTPVEVSKVVCQRESVTSPPWIGTAVRRALQEYYWGCMASICIFGPDVDTWLSYILVSGR